MLDRMLSLDGWLGRRANGFYPPPDPAQLEYCTALGSYLFKIDHSTKSPDHVGGRRKSAYFVGSYDIPVIVNNINKQIYVPVHHRAEILGKQLSVPTRRIIIGQIKAVWVPNRPAVPNVKSIRWHFVATTRRELKFRMHHSYDCSPQDGGETYQQKKSPAGANSGRARDGHPSGRSPNDCTPI